MVALSFFPLRCIDTSYCQSVYEQNKGEACKKFQLLSLGDPRLFRIVKLNLTLKWSALNSIWKNFFLSPQIEGYLNPTSKWAGLPDLRLLIKIAEVRDLFVARKKVSSQKKLLRFSFYFEFFIRSSFERQEPTLETKLLLWLFKSRLEQTVSISESNCTTLE